MSCSVRVCQSIRGTLTASSPLAFPRRFRTSSPLLAPASSLHLQPHHFRQLSSRSPPPPIAKSSNDSTPESARPNDNSDFIAEHHVDPSRSLFPWRSSPAPLPRLVPDTDEYLSEGGSFGPGIPPLNRWVRAAMHWNAASMLNVSFFKIIFLRGWEQELADQFAWAFQMGVAGVLANTYRVPMEQISPAPEDSKEGGKATKVEESFAVDFDQTVDPPPHPVDIKDEKPSEDEFEDESCPDLEYMLQRHLRTLYDTAHEHTRHKLQIQLKTSPTSAEIISLFLVPFLTRERVEATPALRHSFRKIWKALDKREQELGRKLGFGEAMMEIGDQLEQLARRQADKTGILEHTVIAQVAIRCQEVFKVTDVELGEVVQGDPEGRVNDVVHLVRFEMVVRSSIEGGPATLGSWQITDWDDLLGGNVWFV